ncbi:MAG: ribonuclease E/G [Rhodospirillales bacterium]|nr:ribonuclease E/G [Alphaproteobacteria bacterium]USO04597.1 MAG: ribonuclease E/G [Rhodospirillales bacterium]
MRTLDILIEELDGSLWVAAISSRELQGLEVDPVHEQVRWGAIYWAKVTRIDKAMDAAFLDLDGENTGILHNKDVRIEQKNGAVKKGGKEEIGKILTPGQMVAVQAKSGYLAREEDYLLPSEEKSALVSMDITLQGRYLIFSPIMPDNRVSSRIRDKKLRRQLLRMLNATESIKGCILRAAAANTQTDILRREGKIMGAMWEQIQAHLSGDAPALIMEGPDALQRTVSDHAGKTIDRIEIVTMEQFEHVEEWCEIFAPDLVTKIRPVELNDPHAELALFEERDILSKIEDLFQPYTILKQGGNIIIQETTALTAIDVNRGTDGRPAMEVNLDAAGEIGRQLRLRNLGGIIVVDFLKMRGKKDHKTLLAALETIFEKDPCTVQIHGITGLGLVEITRKRRTPALQERFSTAFE